MGSLNPVQQLVIRVAAAVLAGSAALCLAIWIVSVLAGWTRAKKISGAYLFVLPLFICGAVAAFLIVSSQSRVVQTWGDRLREGLRPSGGDDDPYAVLLREGRRLTGPSRWAIRVAGRVLRASDVFLLATLLLSFASVALPLTRDTLGHPWRREAEGRVVSRVFRRIVGMLIFLVLAAAVFAAFSLAFAWLTYALMRLHADLLERAGSELFVLATGIFLVEVVVLFAVSVAAASASTAKAAEGEVNGRLLRQVRPKGLGLALRGFARFTLKLCAVGVAAAIAVRGAAHLPGSAAGWVSTAILAVGVHAALFAWKAHRDFRDLAKATWRLHT